MAVKLASKPSGKLSTNGQAMKCDCNVCNCCQTCGTPWNVPDQPEWLADDFNTKFLEGDVDVIKRVRNYWKKRVHEWIDDVSTDKEDTIPKSLNEVVTFMTEETDLFYCEDCNDGTDGTRCHRNRERCEHATRKRKQEEL